MDERPANIIHQGQVSSYDAKKHTARVAFDDWEGVVSGDLQIIQQGSTRLRVKQPLQVGDHVLCLFQANGLQEGYILGSPYTSSNMPDDGGETDYLMIFPDKEITIRVNSESGKIEILAPNSEVVGTAKNTSMTVSENTQKEVGQNATTKVGQNSATTVGQALTSEALTVGVKAAVSATTSAPVINLNGMINANDLSGDGATTITLNGTVRIRGRLEVIGPVTITNDVAIGGNASVDGNIGAGGDINAGGSITDAGGNTNHHSH